jgi:hypothetical protein
MPDELIYEVVFPMARSPDHPMTRLLLDVFRPKSHPHHARRYSTENRKVLQEPERQREFSKRSLDAKGRIKEPLVRENL